VRRVLIQHAHRAGEISGVTTSIAEMLPSLAARPDVAVRVISTKELTVGNQLQALWASDAVMLNSNCLLLTLLGRLLGKRVVLKLHYPQYQTVHWEHVPMPFRRRIATELRHLLALESSASYIAASIGRLAMRTMVALLASRVCAPSRHCANQASLPREVAVLRNAVKVEAGSPPRSRRTIADPPSFVFVGRVSRDKGWDVLVEAARLLEATGRDFTVEVVGDGPDTQLMLEAVSRLGVADLFRFHGRLSPSAARSVLEGGLAAIVPSRMQETFGYVPLEAASVQVASIVSNAGGLPETAGACCPCFASGNAQQLMVQMAAFVDDPDRALRIGRMAYERAGEEFEPSRVASDLLALLGPRK
jgi:glycosyltransferase involved in cell wall biosynthesis